MVRDPAGDFDHPSLPEGSPLRRHVLYRVTASQVRPYRGAMRRRRRHAAALRLGRQSPEMVAYHDTEWGVPVHDDPTHFEFLVLEGAQAGLSWSTILKRRAGYRKAFAGFDPAKVARFTPARVEKLLPDPGIIRNRAKVESTVRNARAFLAVQEEFGSFDAYIWGFVGGGPSSTSGGAARSCPPSTAGVRGAQRRPAPARLRLRRADRLLRPPAGGRAGQRPPGGLLPLRRAHRRPAHEDAGAETAHDRLLGRQAVGDAASRRPARPRRSPPRRRRARSTGTSR